MTNLPPPTRAGMGTSNQEGTAKKPSLFLRLKGTARRLKIETYALCLAYRDPRTPWLAKVWILFVVAHTFSPIDLIPDFIPVLGYLDDLIITPFGIWLAVKMVPIEVMTEARERAQQLPGPNGRLGRVGAVLVIMIWLVAIAGIVFLFDRLMKD